MLSPRSFPCLALPTARCQHAMVAKRSDKVLLFLVLLLLAVVVDAAVVIVVVG